MDEIFGLIGEVGAPIAGSLVMGFFIFIVIKQMLEGIVDDIKTLTMLNHQNPPMVRFTVEQRVSTAMIKAVQ